MSGDLKATADIKSADILASRDLDAQPPHPNAIRSRALIISAAILWSTGGTAVKLAHATAPQIAMGRAVVAAGVLFLLFKSARARWTRRVFVTAGFYAITCTLYIFANTLT